MKDAAHANNFRLENKYKSQLDDANEAMAKSVKAGLTLQRKVVQTETNQKYVMIPPVIGIKRPAPKHVDDEFAGFLDGLKKLKKD